MKGISFKHITPRLLCLLMIVSVATALPSQAQQQPPQRAFRTYVPADQLVNLPASIPFDQFISLIAPAYERATGKQLISTIERSEPIGAPLIGMYVVDALDQMLARHGLMSRETNRHVLVESAEMAVPAAVATSSAGSTPPAAMGPASKAVSLQTREIQINAILFEVNLSKVRELGVDWGSLLGGGTAGGGTDAGSPAYGIRTGGSLPGLGSGVVVPEVLDVRTLTRALRFLEAEGAGETVARPQISVQSGEQGRIQVGSDVPIQTRDFAGNTITQFFSTGIIVDVTPTLMSEALADTAGAPMLDFIHMDVHVEKSGSRPSGAGPVIDRNTADTQVILLDGEQTVIGGLFSNETATTRRGVPVLKDLPGWFFGLRYVFGTTQNTVAQKELLIVLEAKTVDPLAQRATQLASDPTVQKMLLEKRMKEAVLNHQ